MLSHWAWTGSADSTAMSVKFISNRQCLLVGTTRSRISENCPWVNVQNFLQIIQRVDFHRQLEFPWERRRFCPSLILFRTSVGNCHLPSYLSYRESCICMITFQVPSLGFACARTVVLETRCKKKTHLINGDHTCPVSNNYWKCHSPSASSLMTCLPSTQVSICSDWSPSPMEPDAICSLIQRYIREIQSC